MTHRPRTSLDRPHAVTAPRTLLERPRRRARWRLAVVLVTLGCAELPDDVTASRAQLRSASERPGSAVAIGDAHVCALHDDGRVDCWGANDRGQLGVSGGDRSAPAWVSATYQVDHVVSVAAGHNHTCALRANGTVLCWGDDRQGQLGNGDAPGDPVGGGFTPVQVRALDRVVAIAAGGDTTCALQSNGAVYCWGRNDHRQLGPSMPAGANASAPVMVNFTGDLLFAAQELAVGEGFACVRTARGEVACWGDNHDKQLGADVADAERATPAKVTGVTGWQLALSGARACVLTQGYYDNTRCWGAPAGNALPDAESEVQIGVAPTHACSRTLNGRLFCNGDVTVSNFPLTAESRARGSEVYGISGRVASITVGASNFCARLVDGTLWCWGANSRGQVGNGTTGAAVERPTPVSRPADDAVDAVSVGFAHACAHRANGQVACWGANDRGQILGTTSSPILTPRTLTGVTARAVVAGYLDTWILDAGGALSPRGQTAAGESFTGATDRFFQADTGLGHTCGVDASLGVRCRGNDAFGEVSDPLTITYVRATAVVTGATHTCALAPSGTVSCWGANGHGQLGDGTSTDRRVPGFVTGINDAIALTAGGFYTCALRASGTVSCWGANDMGQLGDGTYVDRTTPRAVAQLQNVVALDAGFAHTCALLGDGTAQCWGDNREGAVGTGSVTETYATPRAVVGVTQATAISAGGATTCAVIAERALLADGTVADDTVRCWGRNSAGQVGDGTTTNRAHPVTVPLR